jgi:archaemetzincin
MHILIHPLQTDVDNDILNLLADSISKEFSGSGVAIGPTYKFNIQIFIDISRNQVKSPDLLNWILNKIKPTKITKILLICDMDAYSDDLNFIFGEAYRGGSIAVVYLPRLREFYGLKPDELLFRERIVKEALHELGHSFGLSHCDNKRCVMFFSYSLYDTDFKGRNFCLICKNHLRYRLI